MINKCVFLSGPITGCTYRGCTDWRKIALSKLEEWGICGISPMRDKQYLSEEDAIKADYDKLPLSSQKGITTRDHFDCCNADVLLVNLLGAKRVSIGTMFEMAWAHTHQIPIVLVMEKEGNLHDYPMVREAAGFRVTSLFAGLDIVRSILGDYSVR